MSKNVVVLDDSDYQRARFHALQSGFHALFSLGMTTMFGLVAAQTTTIDVRFIVAASMAALSALSTGINGYHAFRASKHVGRYDPLVEQRIRYSHAFTAATYFTIVAFAAGGIHGLDSTVGFGTVLTSTLMAVWSAIIGLTAAAKATSLHANRL